MSWIPMGVTASYRSLSNSSIYMKNLGVSTKLREPIQIRGAIEILPTFETDFIFKILLRH